MTKRSERIRLAESREMVYGGGYGAGKAHLNRTISENLQKIEKTLHACPPEGTKAAPATACPQDYTPPKMTAEYEAQVIAMQRLWLGVLRVYQPRFITRQKYSL